MTLGLCVVGLGWEPIGRGNALLLTMVTATVGGLLFTATNLLAWIAAGRPAGAEADVLTMLRRFARRI